MSKISSIVFSYVDDFNLNFKRQSEKLKHCEGEHYKNQELETDGRTDTMIGVEMKAFCAFGRKSTIGRAKFVLPFLEKLSHSTSHLNARTR